jgi:urea transport system ATP-binding protein
MVAVIFCVTCLFCACRECSVVLGRNGVGKTTLLKCLMGILPIKSGQILLDGKDIAKMSPEQRVRAGLAMYRKDEIFFQL